MDLQVAMDISKDALFTALKAGLPMLIAALVVGVTISLIQAVTQVQEMTLTFIPKILAVVATLIVAMPYIWGNLIDFARRVFSQISSI